MTGGGALPDRVGGQTVALFTSPLFHVSGCHSTLVVGLLAGLKLVMVEGRFDPEKALQLIEEHKITLWATVPTMVWRLCEHPDRHDYDTSTIVSVAFGGSPSAEELQRKVRETFPGVSTTTNAYGLTESSSVATAISGQDAVERPHVGRSAGADDGDRHPRRDGHRAAAGRAGRGHDVRPAHHGGLLAQARGDGRDHPGRVAATPATSATSTRTATSTSPTARRT